VRFPKEKTRSNAQPFTKRVDEAAVILYDAP
jgi:hypothetical protein